jgi:hypothetical protein
MESINHDEIDAQELLNWASGRECLQITKVETPIINLFLHDIKIRDRDNEEDLFLKQDDLYERIRRGNCIMTYKMGEDMKYRIARKGLIKFFDYKLKYLNTTDGQCEKKRVFGPIEKIYKDDPNSIVKVSLTAKANGENLQISYDNTHKAWIIGSKNVTILFRNVEDLKYYKNLPRANRYDYCLIFSYVWLKIIEEKLINKGLYEEFIQDISGYSLIGENVGETHQHIKLYTKEDIIFYAMVKNDSKEICVPYDRTYSLLSHKYNLNVVSSESSNDLKNIDEFNHYMVNAYKATLYKSVEEGGEGSVAYIYHDNKVISLAKVKTFEYRFLRKLREKLKGYQKFMGSVDSVLNRMAEECLQFLGEEGENVELSEYLLFAKFILQYVKNAGSKNWDFQKYYASFIYEMKEKFALAKSGQKFNTNDYQETAERFQKKKVANTSNKDDSEDDLKDELQEAGGSQIELNNDKMIIDDNIGGVDKDPKTISYSKLSEEFFKTKTFKKGNVYFFLNVGLVAGGKSTLFDAILKIIEQKYPDMFNTIIVSSDKIRADLTLEEMKKNPLLSFNDAFEKTARESKDLFDETIIDRLKFKVDPEKYNLFLLDKNFFFSQIAKIMEKFEIVVKKLRIETYIFSHKLKYPIRYDKLRMPLSWSYIAQCWQRLKLRKHETLDLEKSPHADYIFISFLMLFKHEKSYMRDAPNNIFIVPLPFADEKEIEPSYELKKLLIQIVDGNAKSMFKIDKLALIDNEIKTFIRKLEEEYPLSNFEDTRPDVYNLLEQCKFFY